MLPERIARSSAVRLTLLYAGLFGAVVLLLFGYVYWSTTSYLSARSDRAIRAEHSVLLDAYAQSGRQGLIDLVKRRTQDRSFRVYLVTDEAFRPVAGNLEAWPAGLEGSKGWADFSGSAMHATRDGGVLLRATYETLPDGYHLLVGRAIDDLGEVAATINGGLVVAVGLMIVVAAVAGISVTRRTVGRIETINVISRQIMRSDLRQRMPVRGVGDEWDRLAESLNSMLDRIEQLIHEITQVSDNLAHDLRTPLMRLRGRLEHAYHRPRDADDDRQLIENSLVDLDAVLGTFAAILRIAKIGARDRQAAFRPLDLAAVARDVAELYGPGAEEQGGSIRLEVIGEAEVIGDRDLLFNAMSNLIDNAFKHGGSPPLVTITVGSAPTPFFAIGDRGPGIPPEDRQDVLKRFFRLERSRHAPGSGLGLSLVVAVAQVHGATLELDDDAPGLIVRFRFDAPPAHS
jgi:signal transduction histidine kinase